MTSTERGRAPSPGIVHAPFFWGDILDGAPPSRRNHGEGSYILYHALETGIDTRLAYSTLIRVTRTGGVDDITVDSRITVQKRLFLEAIHKERQMMEAFTARARRRFSDHLVKVRRAANALPTWTHPAARWTIRTEAKIGLFAIDVPRRVSHALVQIPDSLYSGFVRAWSLLYGRFGRQTLWQDMRDPRNLSTEQKSVVLALTGAILVGAVLVMNNLVTLFTPRAAVAWSDLLNTFMWGVGTAVALPFPPSELLVIKPYLSAGPILAFLSIFASKVVGAWIVYFIGDALHAFIEKQTHGKPRTQRIVEWMNRNSEKYGFWLLGLFTALPFLPDTLALYVFAASGTNFKSYIGGVALGTAIRYLAVVGVAMLIGPGTLTDWFG